jgi:hypothetical protein
MKIVITENQYNLLLEQPNVYTNEVSYKNALKIYDEVFKIYNDSVKYYNFVKLLPNDIDFTPALDRTDNRPLIFFTNKTKKRTADFLTKNAELYKKNGLEVEFWYGKSWRSQDGRFRDGEIEKGSNNGTYEDLKKNIFWGDDFMVYPYVIAPLFKKPNILKPILQPKTPPVINYRELKSQLTFAPQFKTGTPVIELNIPGGPYYLTYPEFETYKKSRPNTTFKKI